MSRKTLITGITNQDGSYLAELLLAVCVDYKAISIDQFVTAYREDILNCNI